MMHTLRQTLAGGLLALGLFALPGSGQAAEENMIGIQTQNEGMFSVPAPATGVTIDGKLDEWDWSGRIWCFADWDQRQRYSVEVASMWDAKGLYVAIKWQDPTPMFSMVDPEFSPDSGWRADAVQLRVQTDATMWLTTWNFTPKNQPVLHKSVWKVPRDSRKGQDITLLMAKPGDTHLGEGAEMAYHKNDDGKGFVQEMLLPWTMLYAQPPVAAPEQTLRMGMEFLWGDPTGKVFPEHRYADNMQPGMTSREFYWTAYNAWGDIKLLAKGNLTPRNYVHNAEKQAGTIPVRATIPADATRFTVVLETPNGTRVRNLAGDFDALDYSVPADDAAAKAAAPGTRVVEVMWDGLDDNGKLAAPGVYAVRGITQKGLDAHYEMTYYNPGTPAWDTVSGAGAWGADHTEPLHVERAGDTMIVTWPFAEGGSGVVGVGPDGFKKWGEKRGGKFLASDANYVYIVPAEFNIKEEVLARLATADGAYKPFILNGTPRPFELPTHDIFGDQAAALGQIVDMASNGRVLVLAMSGGKLAVLNAETAELLKVLDAPDVKAVTFAPKADAAAEAALNDVVVLLGNNAARLDLTSGATTPLATPGVAIARDVALDNDGNLVVLDLGPDMQAKVYSPDGKLLYTCGKPGGRAIRGDFDTSALRNMSSVAVDQSGLIWIVENWAYPRRVSLWGKDGKLAKQYVGNTGYAGQGTYLHDQNPNLAFVGPIEVTLDKAARDWHVSSVMWVADKTKGEAFKIMNNGNVMPQRFTSSVSGKPHEYFYAHDPRFESGHVIYMQFPDGNWKPVAALCYVGHFTNSFDNSNGVVSEPDGEFAGLNADDIAVWNDTNKDGIPQRSECAFIPTPTPPKPDAKNQNSKKGNRRINPAFSLTNGWGGRLSQDLVFYVDGIKEIKPLRFDADGSPIYGLESIRDIGLDERGDLVPVPEDKMLLVMSMAGYPNNTWMRGVDPANGKVLWQYPNPYPGVHGSHRAIMPSPGLLIGPLKILGVADVNPEVGRVFALRGNLGQDFFMTTDGIYVGALFQDGRRPKDGMPATEDALLNRSLAAFSEGGEPFNGWFGKQSDGVYRLTTGMARQAGMLLSIQGLDTIKRYTAEPVTVDQAMLVQADADNAKRAQDAAAPKAVAVVRTPIVPTIDGKLVMDKEGWSSAKVIDLPNKVGTVRLTWDDTALYAAFQVSDKASAWKNEGKDLARLFKTGDAVDIQLGAAREKLQKDPAVGDQRLVVANLNGAPSVILMRAVEPGAPKTAAHAYASPVGVKKFDRVEVLADAKAAVSTNGNGYIVEVMVPWSALGIKPATGMKLLGDVGVIGSDNDGRINESRTYWSNPATNLVNDEPLEAWFSPSTWGTLTLE